MKTETELHKALLEWLGCVKMLQCPCTIGYGGGTPVDNNCKWCEGTGQIFSTDNPKMDANLIRQCREKMTEDELWEYWSNLYCSIYNVTTMPHQMAICTIVRLLKEPTIPQQATAILKAVEKKLDDKKNL